MFRRITKIQAVSARRTTIDCFISGLCWRSRALGGASSAIPSRSWTGWTCQVDVFAPEYENRLNIMSDPDIAIQLSNEDKTSLEDFDRVLDSYMKDGQRPHLRPEVTRDN